MKDRYLAVAMFLALLVTFAVGREYGIKNSPEYVAMKMQISDRVRKETDSINELYATSQDAVCERIYDAVLDDLQAGAARDYADRN